MKLTIIPVLFLVTLAISACVTAGGTVQGDRQAQHSAPTPDNIDPRWKAGKCIQMDMDIDTQKQCWAYVTSQLPPLDPGHRELFGEKYDPQKFLKCRNEMSNNASCDVYRLRRVENPEYWPYPDVPKTKWPDAPKESVYKPGMSSKQYFDALCKAEAGEFIYKTVENVEGVYQVRPRNKAEYGDYFQADRYVMEDPYGFTEWEADNAPTLFVAPPFRNYKFFEAPQIKEGEVIYHRFHGYKPEGRSKSFIEEFGYQQEKHPMEQEITLEPKAQYGFTWRGISRPHDRELGIAGGEFIVVDLKTNEIIGLRRGFIRAGERLPSKVWWLSGGVCPVLAEKPGRSKDVDFTYRFVSKVAKPIAQ